jgi:hypothetical protein
MQGRMNKFFSWAELVLGVWIVVSPWVFGFSGTLALWSNVFVGAAFVVLAFWRIFGEEGSK